MGRIRCLDSFINGPETTVMISANGSAEAHSRRRSQDARIFFCQRKLRILAFRN